jgi:uncharacterized protein (TIGR03905 family)
VEFDVEEGKLASVVFKGGCSGNLQGISRLIEGLEVEDAIRRLSGIRCGDSDTSCPDQLAKGLASLSGTADPS